MSDPTPAPPPAAVAPTVTLPAIIWYVPDYGAHDSGGDNDILPIAFCDQQLASSYTEPHGGLGPGIRRIRLLGALPERRTIHTVHVTRGSNSLNERWRTAELWDTEIAPDELHVLLAGQPYTRTRRWGGNTVVEVVTTSLDLDQARRAAREQATAVWGRHEAIGMAQRVALDAAVQDRSASPTGEPADLTDEELAELEAIDAAAATRPWNQARRGATRARYGFPFPNDRFRLDWDAGFDGSDLDDGDGGSTDVQWVAAFGRAAPRLLAELRRRRAEATQPI